MQDIQLYNSKIELINKFDEKNNKKYIKKKVKDLLSDRKKIK